MPSFFQKRLLKYALSRLGLVDTEALDPDNLGIRWGQRSTIELKDIGLKLEVSWCCDLPRAAGRPSVIIERDYGAVRADYLHRGIEIIDST